MDYLNNLNKSTNWMTKLSRNLDFSSPLSNILNSQQNTLNKLSGLNMLNVIERSLYNQSSFPNQKFKSIQEITNPLNFQSKFNIPKSTINAISSINIHHNQFFESIKMMTDTLKTNSPIITQISSLNFALNQISKQIASISTIQTNWSLINDYDDVTEKAIKFAETLESSTDEEQKRQFQILLNLVSTFIKKHKALGVYSLLLIDIILRITNTHQYLDFIQDKPELATEKGVTQMKMKQDSTNYFIQQVSKQLKEIKEFRITNTRCNVKLKPKKKSTILTKLPVDFEVIILQINHKWVYVSYFDPIDNLPQTGWIMKKYLDKP
jgi:hypothetical protein